MATSQRIKLPIEDQREKRREIARAYVELDRVFYCNPINRDSVRKRLDEVKRAIKVAPAAPAALKELCQAGADEEEILWLLSGCRSKHVFGNTEEAFGLSADELTHTLVSARNLANVLNQMRRYTFGVLLDRVLLAHRLPETLQEVVRLASAAKGTFGHRSEWFLNIAKARLVIHIRSQTKGRTYDQAIADLVSAVLCVTYDASAQSSWRRKHDYLIDRPYIDGETAMSRSERRKKRKVWEEIAANFPDIVGQQASDFQYLDEIRSGLRKVAKAPKR
jgi:hypothetical protein